MSDSGVYSATGRLQFLGSMKKIGKNMYTIHEESLPGEQYNELREIVGWGALDPDKVKSSLPNSLYSVLAKYNDEIIGFTRVVGDGGLSFYIPDIIIHPMHQRKGIATKFMDCIMKFLQKNACDRSYVCVFVGNEVAMTKFYEKYGFWKRPTINMGPGMFQFWNDPEYNKQRCNPPG
jgi:ribosomal protein S18 acetylase RimI-like enzyme